MHDAVRTVLSFVLVLGVLVFIHELGHYLAARWRGVHVEVFSIGFGKPLLRWHDRVGTEWRLCALPIGGYVKPHGFEGPEEASDEQKAAWIPGRTFHDKPVGSRAIVILAGPVFNFLLAMVLFSALFCFSGREDVGTRVDKVVAGGAAEAAGVKAGDEIIRIGGRPVSDFSELQPMIASEPGMHTTIDVHRGASDISLPVAIGVVPGTDKAPVGQLGVVFAVRVGKPMPFPQAVIAGTKMTWTVSVQTLAGVWEMICGRHSAKDLGALRIAQMSGQAAQYGVASLVSFMALLSVNLGLINLFPIPVLDGGRLVFYAVEAIRGRPVPRRIQEISFQAGFALIAGLFLFSTFNDLSSFGLFRWLASHLG